MSKSKSSSDQLRGSSRKRGNKVELSRSDDGRRGQILRERARKLAVRIDESALEKLSISSVTLVIGEKKLAIETRYVLAALPVPPIVNLPLTGSHVEGLTLILGRLLPVFDLMGLMELGTDSVERRPLLAIFGTDQPEFGVRVDEVLPSRSFAVGELHEFLDEDVESRGLIQGIIADGTIFVNGQALLNHPALFL